MPESLASPPDQRERLRALDSARSVLVQAPAGSGKTDLLTRRFLRLLAEVESPTEIVAITFTNAAAAEMRHRILGELEKAAQSAQYETTSQVDEFSMAALAHRALRHSRALGWNLLETPAQLRISTIDSFCRELALQQPLLSSLGEGLAIAEQPSELYRRAARRTLEQIDSGPGALSSAIETLLDWRDNNWQDLEDQLVAMLEKRDRWMQDFVLQRNPDWDWLRAHLERPLANAVRVHLAVLNGLLKQVSGTHDEILALARFACEQSGGTLHRDLAEIVEFPCAPFADLPEAQQAYLCLAKLLLTNDDEFRKQVNKSLGFPADRRHEKNRILALIARLVEIPGFESALAAVRCLPPARYTEDEWRIVRACFTLLRYAAAELRVVFAESGTADFTEVAQIAHGILRPEDGQPTEAAQSIADGIRHLLVDEFQDTSRRQHRFLADLAAAWPERHGRTCFVVGDPMQSIYFFRDADSELFPRVRTLGLEVEDSEPLHFEFVPLSANFRTAPQLVGELNYAFGKIFAQPDGSGIEFSPAIAGRASSNSGAPVFSLHLAFAPQNARNAHLDVDEEIEAVCSAQTEELIALIRSYQPAIEDSRVNGGKFRLAVLGRTRRALTPVAAALREAQIPFRAIDLESLADRPEVQDVLSLAHALLNSHDRVAWLGVLRAPSCGLPLADLHRLVSDDNDELLARPVPDLLAERLPLLTQEAQLAGQRVLEAIDVAPVLRTSLSNATLGTWLEQVWLRLGGADCVDAAGRANINLLWSLLDKLPGGEQDLFSPTLDAALRNLTAQPDPEASSDFGVQLMTIHKAKGLEFEVVIVPELQAACGRGSREMLSWLERGVTPDDTRVSSDEFAGPTEFLIAPIQTKGAKGGDAKKWVDRVRREREQQEDRRILYVAATRAREHLHLFARPSYKIEKDGSLNLCQPKESLLKTAWPALEEEVRNRFDIWKEAKVQPTAEPAMLVSLAAAAEVIELARPLQGTLLRRLPADYRSASPEAIAWLRPQSAIGTAPSNAHLYARHEGGLASRALGRAIHSLLESLGNLRRDLDWNSARSSLSQFGPRIAAQIRGSGIDPQPSHALASQALEATLKVSHHPLGQWILSPHPGAATEVRWTGVLDGALRTVQVDRIFRAGPAPLEPGDDCWWIVDYKSFEEPAASESGHDVLLRLRSLFSPQLELYAQVLRKLHGNNANVRAALCYPRMLLFDWWEVHSDRT